MNYYLGLDVGGTNLAAGLVNEKYEICYRESMPSGAARSIEEITSDMAKVSMAVVEKAGLSVTDIASWGIGMPSYVNPATGLLVHANCFGWRNVPIYSYLEKHISLPIYIENDANCAVLGEMLAADVSGYKNVLMLTLGTGVGSGIILDGKIYAGADLLGAELGHTKLVVDGRACTCGQNGCVDAYCSASALVSQAREMLAGNQDSIMLKMSGNDITKIEAKTVFQAMERGDRAAVEVWKSYIKYLSAAIGNFIAIFRPEIIILGGGVTNAGEKLLEPLKEKVYENTFASKEIGVPNIRIAQCGNDAGIIGAAFLKEYGADRRQGKKKA